MSQEQAKYLCKAARDAIDAGMAQGWALVFPTASVTLSTSSGYLLGASAELGGNPNLQSLAGEVAARAAEIIAFAAIPWPFVYAAIGPWANALGRIKARIPDIVILEPVGPTGFRAPVASAPAPAHLTGLPVADWPALAAREQGAGHSGKGPRNYRRSDARILEDLCEALSLHPLLDASGLEVEVRDGTVTLTGRVVDRAAKRRAEDTALAVRGVVDVANHLEAGEAGRHDGTDERVDVGG